MINSFFRYCISVVFFLCLASCNQNEAYFKFISIPQNNWNKQEEVCFLMDSSSFIPNHKYAISLEITHNINYPYKNLFLYLNHTLDDKILSQDTIECNLVDELGKWQGSGNGATRNLSVLYKTNLILDTTLHNEICIRHAMQDQNLKGIERIGLKVY